MDIFLDIVKCTGVSLVSLSNLHLFIYFQAKSQTNKQCNGASLKGLANLSVLNIFPDKFSLE